MSAFLTIIFLLVACTTAPSAVGAPSPKLLDFTKWSGKRVLFIAAHPDDIEASAGGLITRMVSSNVNVFLLIVTDGNKGCSSPLCESFSLPQIASMRILEALAAARALGVVARDRVTFLHYSDSQVTSVPEVQIKMELIAHLRRVQPSAVFTWNPNARLDLQPSFWHDLGFHPDHQAVGKLALETTLYGTHLNLLYPTLGTAWRVDEFYMFCYTISEATHVVDVGGTTLQRKIGAFLEHCSQYTDAAIINATLTELATRIATQVNVNPGIRFAEAFQSYN